MSPTSSPTPSSTASESPTPSASTSKSAYPSPHPWKKLPTTKNLESAFDDEYTSFNISKNIDFCDTQVFTVSYDSNIQDYAPMINERLASVADFGGSVRLDAGLYPVKGPVYIPSRTCLIGDSSKTTFISVVDYSRFATGTKAVVTSISGQYISIRDISVGISLDLVKNFDLSGIYIGTVNYASLKNVNSSGHSKHGFEVQGYENMMAAHLYFESCVAGANKKTGFNLSYSAYASIHFCKIFNNGKSGISISSGAKATSLTYNDLDDNGFLDNITIGANATVDEERWNTCPILIKGEDGKLAPEQVKLVENKIINVTYAGVCAKEVKSIDDHRTTVSNYDIMDHYCYDLQDVRDFMTYRMNCRFPKAVFYPGVLSAIAQIQPTPSATPSGSSKSSPVPGNEVGCDGIITNNVCCPMSCETCSNGQCPSKVKDCCADDIKQRSWLHKCSVDKPPCFLEK